MAAQQAYINKDHNKLPVLIHSGAKMAYVNQVQDGKIYNMEAQQPYINKCRNKLSDTLNPNGTDKHIYENKALGVMRI